jgi:hypothetical protein
MAPRFLVACSSSLPIWSLGEFDRLPIERPAIRLADDASFDARLWRQTGLLPWFEVASEPYLEVPLVTDGAGYRLFRSQLAAGRLLPESAIRVEDFLAGIDYGLASTTVVEPKILVSAAPSPFSRPLADGMGDGERWLVMLSVVLPDEPNNEGEPASDGQRHVQLAIQFAPKEVVAYRVIGYGPPHSGGSVPQRWDDEEDRSGQLSMATDKAAIVICEIQTATAHDPTADLAQVSLRADDETWPNRRRRDLKAAATLRAESFTIDVEAAPLAWQQAALVALAAEQLAGSPFAEDVSFAEIAARARRIEPRVFDRAGWREFIEMLAAAQSARGSLLRAF